MGANQTYMGTNQKCMGTNQKRMGTNHTALGQGTKSEVGHKWAGWLHNPYHLGPQCFRATKLAVAVKSGKTYFFGKFFT